MIYKTYLAVLDFPNPITGDIYPRHVVEEAIQAHRHQLNNKLICGCLIDDENTINSLRNTPPTNSTENSYEEFQIKRNLEYFRVKSNNISHMIVDMCIEGDNWVAEIETLETGRGMALREQLALNPGIVKFRPVVIRERLNGNVTLITNIVSVDAIIQ